MITAACNYKGQKFGDWHIVDYKEATDMFVVRNSAGTRMAEASGEFVVEQLKKERVNQTKKEKKMTDEQARQYGYNGVGTISQFDYNKLFGAPYTNAPSTNKTMTRLTQYNDWTILLGNDSKLSAVDSTGQTIHAKGSLLSAGGRAWMYVNGQLWSGELERHETEKEARENEKKAAAEKVRAKFHKRLATLNDKELKLIEARDEALRSL